MANISQRRELELRRKLNQGGLQTKQELEIRRTLRDAQEDSADATFLNQGIARSVGAPVDIANELLGLAGLDSENPIGGRKSIQDAMNFVGRELFSARMTPKEGEQPDTLGESVLRGIGDAAGGLVPFGGAARMASGGKQGLQRLATDASRTPTQQGVTRGAAQTAAKSTGRRPIRNLSAEVGAGATSGAGGQVAAETFTDTPEARAMGEIAGGFGMPAGVSALKNVPSVALLRKAGQMSAPFKPSTEATPRDYDRASRRLHDLAGDQEAAKRALDRETMSDLTPAQRTGDRRLLSLEASARRGDPELDARIDQRLGQADLTLQQEARKIADDANASEARSFLQKRSQQAFDEANRRLGRMRPEQREGQASRIVREELDKAYQQARQQERRLWNQVPDDEMVPTGNVRQKYRELMADLPRAQREDMPDIARRMLHRRSSNQDDAPGDASSVSKGANGVPGREGLGNEDSVREMRGLYSKLRETAQKADAAEERNTARLARELQDSILDDFDAAEGVSDQYARARAFSNEVAGTFRRQPNVARVLGVDRRGGASVASEETLSQTVGRSGERGRVAADELLKAVENAPQETQRQIDDFIRSRFRDAAVRNDEVQSQAAESFLNKNQAILERFPSVRKDIEAAIKGKRGVEAFQRSDVGRFLQAPEGQEIQRTLQARSPREAARSLMQEAQKDTSARAQRGLKRGLVDYMFERARTGQFDESGRPVISGRALRAQVNDRRLKPVLQEVLSDGDRQRLGRIMREYQKIDRARQAKPAPEGVINDAPSNALETAARVTGAQAGNQIAQATGGGTVQTPGIVSGKAKQMVQRLTNDQARDLLVQSVEDRNLFKALMNNMGSPKAEQQTIQRLNAYLGGPTSEMVEQKMPDRPPQIDITRFNQERGGPQAQ